MDIEKIFHMKGGHDDTSYSKNSTLQKKASEMVKQITMETIQEVYLTTSPQNLAVADLGCSTGSNSLSIIKELYNAVINAYNKAQNNGPKSPPPQLCVYLNDLPTNDFNSIFKALPEFYQNNICKEVDDGNRVNGSDQQGYIRPSVFVAACPGSFYAPVFPPNFLHFVYSSYSLHWLSKVPNGIYDENGESMNKGCIYICKESPASIIQAYVQQFQDDFSRFLRLRSQELKNGGRMVLVLLGRENTNHIDRGNSFLWQLLAQSFRILVSKGLIPEEKLNSYDVHFYAPSKEEMQEEVRKEGSFKMVRFEMFEIERDENYGDNYGVDVARTVRAIQESMISHHFGEDILDDLFDTYAKLIDEEMSMQDIRPVTFVLVLNKV
ncbi:putative methyltransferase TCM_000336 [Silene latifolia]|uniref:putative methyltransferase TCM_000336 n=1 Tax=Silene latifolia TaxID=37657 RepID=UPI003D76EE0E